MNSESHSLLELMTSDPIVPASLDGSCFTMNEDSALLSTMQAQSYNILQFNPRRVSAPG